MSASGSARANLPRRSTWAGAAVRRSP